MGCTIDPSPISDWFTATPDSNSDIVVQGSTIDNINADTYTIGCDVTDSHGTSDTYEITLEVIENSAPTIVQANIPPFAYVNLGTVYTRSFAGLCVDSNTQDTLTYTMTANDIAVTNCPGSFLSFDGTTFTITHNDVANA